MTQALILRRRYTRRQTCTHGPASSQLCAACTAHSPIPSFFISDLAEQEGKATPGLEEVDNEIRILYGNHPFLPIDGRYFRRFTIHCSHCPTGWKRDLAERLTDLAAQHLGDDRVFEYCDEADGYPEGGMYDPECDVDEARDALFEALPPPQWKGPRCDKSKFSSDAGSKSGTNPDESGVRCRVHPEFQENAAAYNAVGYNAMATLAYNAVAPSAQEQIQMMPPSALRTARTPLLQP